MVYWSDFVYMSPMQIHREPSSIGAMGHELRGHKCSLRANPERTKGSCLNCVVHNLKNDTTSDNDHPPER